MSLNLPQTLLVFARYGMGISVYILYTVCVYSSLRSVYVIYAGCA